MRLVYEGKTKRVEELENGTYILTFKDDATGEDGKFDPGANTVGLSIAGLGRGGLRLSDYFFKKIEAAGFPTHYISADMDQAAMTVKPATVFGQGLEVICRFRAVGSFIKRYGMYAQEGQELDAFVEVTLKDDARQDPPISKDALDMLNILSAEEYDVLEDLTKKISRLIKDDLAATGAELYDIKLEFGRVDSQIVLIDEISGGNMRVYYDDVLIEPLDLVKIVFWDEDWS
ncbi:MAG: phosphoribosylaminoimidazolesuccinocarboxamide synthase [Peptococcaceae bacterium]|nr:phosphoribosylaminoimidazolesuccinocarboxamide synthase [Peptococcaceae bacterium]